MGAVDSARAANVTFASFSQADNNATRSFMLGNDGVNSMFSVSTLIHFQFANILHPGSLPAQLQPGNQVDAMLTVTGASSTPGTDSGFIYQCCFTGGFTIVLPVAIGGHTNLLSGTFNNGGISGPSGGEGASFNAGNIGGSQLAFTSDFILISGTKRAMSVAMTGGDSSLSLAASGLLSPMNLTGTGTFSSDPAPVSNPEPSTVLLLGSSLFALGFWLKKRSA